jgi:hypothetical protein
MIPKEAVRPTAQIPMAAITPTESPRLSQDVPTISRGPGAAVAAELRRYGEEFLPGAAEKIGAVWNDLGSLPPHAIAQAVAERLARGGAMVDRFRDPEYVAPKLPNGAAPSPLRAALLRNADQLRPGAVDELAAAWALDTAGMSPSRTSGEVARRLGLRENEGYLAAPPAPPAHEQRIASVVLDHFGDVFSPEGASRFARERSQQLRNMPDREVVRQVAGALRAGPVRDRYGASALASDEPRDR